MTIAGLHVQIIKVLEIKDHHVAHVKKDWQADREQSYCHHTRNSIIFTPFKLVLDTSDREQAYLSRQEYLQKEEQVYPEKDPLEEVTTRQDDSHPSTADLLVVPETYAAASVEKNAEEEHNQYHTYRRELKRDEVGGEVAHLKVGPTESLLLCEL